MHTRTIENEYTALSRSKLSIMIPITMGFLITLLADERLVRLFYITSEYHIDQEDSYRLFRVLGYLGTWAAIALLLAIHDRHRHRGLALLMSTGLAGLIAEVLKLIVARERPMIGGVLQDSGYHFRGLFSGFYASGKNLGFPSSHTAVAFGGCIMLAYFFRELRYVLVLLALGCGITRMLMGAHYASDVFGGALVGWAAAVIIARSARKSVNKCDQYPF